MNLLPRLPSPAAAALADALDALQAAAVDTGGLQGQARVGLSHGLHILSLPSSIGCACVCCLLLTSLLL